MSSENWNSLTNYDSSPSKKGTASHQQWAYKPVTLPEKMPGNVFKGGIHLEDQDLRRLKGPLYVPGTFHVASNVITEGLIYFMEAVCIAKFLGMSFGQIYCWYGSVDHPTHN